MNRVILVDDEMFARKGLSNLIPWDRYGYEIVGEAENGEEALEIIQKYNPDLVITDIRMPVLDGLELIRQAKQLNTAPPQFIIVSGYDDFKYAQQAVRFGVQDFILKPVDEEELVSTLQRISGALSQSEPSAEAGTGKSIRRCSGTCSRKI
ncbi:response regulator [Paenibacillus tarimensis]